ncbi:MAG: CRISPR-associated endoribonuclease Cas6 [Prochlorothrix sp.]|nr:CRISPR-associated endoribonuclease Cas6 [Prochlorothrix sp.]
MPHSLVLNLVPETPIPPGFTTGKHLHALFLNLVSTIDRPLGDHLHANAANKAFTLSPLQVTRLQQQPIKLKKPAQPESLTYNHMKPIAPGQSCWWRISLLDDRLFSQLTPLWLNLNPAQPWHLGPANLHITSILGTPQSTQPWANFQTYGQLYDQASSQDRKLTLQFSTPTAFRQGKYDSTLPTAEQVFGSLLRRWNFYSDFPFDSVGLEAVQPSGFEIRTVVVRDPREQFQQTGARVSVMGQFVGCVGTVTYQVLGTVEEQMLKRLNALTDFALYAGVGRKTPMGMGMCRRVEGF